MVTLNVSKMSHNWYEYAWLSSILIQCRYLPVRMYGPIGTLKFWNSMDLGGQVDSLGYMNGYFSRLRYCSISTLNLVISVHLTTQFPIFSKSGFWFLVFGFWVLVFGFCGFYCFTICH
jgi:hypothetical protein